MPRPPKLKLPVCSPKESPPRCPGRSNAPRSEKLIVLGKCSNSIGNGGEAACAGVCDAMCCNTDRPFTALGKAIDEIAPRCPPSPCSCPQPLATQTPATTAAARWKCTAPLVPCANTRAAAAAAAAAAGVDVAAAAAAAAAVVLVRRRLRPATRAARSSGPGPSAATAAVARPPLLLLLLLFSSAALIRNRNEQLEYDHVFTQAVYQAKTN